MTSREEDIKQKTISFIMENKTIFEELEKPKLGNHLIKYYAVDE